MKDYKLRDLRASHTFYSFFTGLFFYVDKKLGLSKVCRGDCGKMVKACWICGLELEERSTDPSKCARERFQNTCCNCRQRKGKSNFGCSQCMQRLYVFDTDVATAVLMACHTRLGNASCLGHLLVHLEPQLTAEIISDGAMRAANLARLQKCSTAEVCVSYLQLGYCPNGKDCEFYHCVSKPSYGGGQMPPGYTFVDGELCVEAAERNYTFRSLHSPVNILSSISSSPLSSPLSSISQFWRRTRCISMSGSGDLGMPDISTIDMSEGELGSARKRVGGGCDTEEQKKEGNPKQRLQFPAPLCTLDRCRCRCSTAYYQEALRG